MKTAIVYYSMSGNTEFVARRIAEEMPADLIRLEPRKEFPKTGPAKFIVGGAATVFGRTPELLPYRFDASEYDRVVLGTPVWASCFAPPLRTFLEQERDALASMRVAAFACSSGGDATKTFQKLKEQLGVPALEAELSLVDPKDQRKRMDDDAIRVFCSQLG